MKMEEYLVGELKNVVDLTKEGVVKAVAILQDQAPLLVREILNWNFTMSLIQLFGGIALLVFTFIAIKIVIKTNKEGYSGDNSYLSAGDMSKVIIFGITGFFTLMFGIGTVICVKSFIWLQILLAPKLFLIEYVKTLVK